MTFKFINTSYTGMDAAGGTEEDGFDLTGVFKNQTIDSKFKIGNTGASEASFNITASGLESDITDAVSFSTDDGITFETTATVSGLQPNEISDTIITRFEVPEDAYLTSGTFLIRVDEV